jgi:hypothetical protein
MKYQYEITKVDAEARCMEIVYTSEGLPSYTVGARLPYEGETLEQIIHSYAPMQFWEHFTKVDVVPQTGKGEVDVAALEAARQAALEAEIAAIRASQPQPVSTGAQTL